MANKTFDREIINIRERPLSSDINTAESYLDYTLRSFLDQLFLGRVSKDSDAAGSPISGFVGEGFKLRPTSPVTYNLQLSAGLGFFYDGADLPTNIDAIVGLNDLSRWKPLVLPSAVTLSGIPSAPSAPNSRIDIVEVKPYRRRTDSDSRDVLDPITGTFTATSVRKTLAWNLESELTYNGAGSINYKTGTPAVSPSAPATDSGYIKIAEVLVGSAVTTLDGDVIKGLRKLLFPYNQGVVRAHVWGKVLGGTTYLRALSAPPGVTVSAVWISATDAEVHLYVVAGDPPILATESLCALAGNSNDGVSTLPVVCLAELVTVTSVEQALLVGANASPAIKVAIGQKVYRVTLKAPGITGVAGMLYGVQLSLPQGV